MSLSGQNAVVTGGAQGIGKAMTEILLENGAKVAILDVKKTVGESLKETLSKQYGAGNTVFLECDVESEEQFKAAIQKAADTLGGIDIFCNNAGILNEAEWEKTVSINLMGVIRGTYLAMEHMSKLKGGRGGVVISTASLAGLGPFPTCPVYTATKHGVVGFTRAMAAASAISGYGLRFNALCPGFVQTELITSIPFQMGQFSHMINEAKQLMDKMGVITPSEAAECLLELVKDETKNGEVLVVSQSGKKYMVFPSPSQAGVTNK